MNKNIFLESITFELWVPIIRRISDNELKHGMCKQFESSLKTIFQKDLEAKGLP